MSGHLDDVVITSGNALESTRSFDSGSDSDPLDLDSPL